MEIKKKHIGTILFIFCIYFISGCGGSRVHAIIKPGDTVTLNYTCRGSDGSVISTVEENIGKNDSVSKSPVFISPEKYEPVSIIASERIDRKGQDSLRSLEDELISGLAEKIINMKDKQHSEVIINAPTYSHLPKTERYISMARIRKRPKQKSLSMRRFLGFSRQQQPVLGMIIDLEKGFKGKVSEIKDERVYLDVLAKDGDIIDTFMGRAVISEKKGNYEIEIMAKTGNLVRLANLVGEITEIKDDLIKMDFGNPFGNQTLVCDVSIKDVVEGEIFPDGVNNKKDAMAILGKALEDAKAGGQKNVYIDLDEVPDKVQKGDLVALDFTVYSDSRQIIYSTEKIYASQDKTGFPLYDRMFGNMTVPPAKSLLVGIDEPVKGLEHALLNTRIGDRKIVKIPPEKAYGPVLASKIKQFPCTKVSQRKIKIPMKEYIKNVGSVPILNKVIFINPYLEAQITEFDDNEVVLELVAENGKIIEDELGKTLVTVKGEFISLTLTPEIGADFKMGNQTGTVTAVNEGEFTVDFNHPLAGKELIFEIQLNDLIKASKLMSREVVWKEDYDEVLQLARDNHKPIALILFASWCKWSQKLINEVINDPRIKLYNNDFIWTKINSDLEREFKEIYEQEGYPMVVLMNADGDVIKKMEGFQNADALRQELKSCLENETSL